MNLSPLSRRPVAFSAAFSAALSLLLAGCDMTSDRFSPYSPHAVAATGGIGLARVEWDPSLGGSDSASIRYTAVAVQDPSKRCSTVGALSCTITGLTNDQSYTFAVTASGPGGTSPRSKSSEAVTPSSVPGVNWWKRVSGTTDILEGVVWTGTRLVVVGGGYSGNQMHATITTSTDGLTWGDLKLIDGGRLFSVAWTGSLLVAVGGTGTRGFVLTSPDGATWTERTVPTSPTSPYLRKVAWADDRLVAVGDNGKIVTSTDGITWTSVSPAGSASSYLSAVAWTGTRWVAGGWKTTSGYQGVLITSANGTVWTLSTVTQVQNPLVWTGTQFLGWGLGDSTWSSPDGIVWTGAVTNISGMVDVAWMSPAGAMPGQFVAVVTGGETFARSPDGINWTQRTVDPRGYGYGSFNAVAVLPDKLVIVGDNGDIRLSP